ncbi:TraM recognition domain-containing protein [Yinghuangia aomiensis]
MQSPAQLYDTWTKYRGQIIWSNLTQIVLGGLAVMEHLEEISKLCGERVEVTPSTSNGPNGRSTSYSERRVPAMSLGRRPDDPGVGRRCCCPRRSAR